MGADLNTVIRNVIFFVQMKQMAPDQELKQ